MCSFNAIQNYRHTTVEIFRWGWRARTKFGVPPLARFNDEEAAANKTTRRCRQRQSDVQRRKRWVCILYVQTKTMGVLNAGGALACLSFRRHVKFHNYARHGRKLRDKRREDISHGFIVLCGVCCDVEGTQHSTAHMLGAI